MVVFYSALYGSVRGEVRCPGAQLVLLPVVNFSFGLSKLLSAFRVSGVLHLILDPTKPLVLLRCYFISSLVETSLTVIPALVVA